MDWRETRFPTADAYRSGQPPMTDGYDCADTFILPRCGDSWIRLAVLISCSEAVISCSEEESDEVWGKSLRRRDRSR